MGAPIHAGLTMPAETRSEHCFIPAALVRLRGETLAESFDEME